MTSPLPTYVVLRTIEDDGTVITDRPTSERIEATYEPVPGWARYDAALTHCHEIRKAGGWALPLDVESLWLYEPGGLW